MTSRRDLILGGACVLGAAGAFGLTPHKRISLMGKAKLDDIVPRRFGAWVARDVSDLVAPQEDDSLAARLYQDRLERTYQNQQNGAEIMMLMAHGDSQTNELQLHRPEVCYPAFGYEIKQSQPTQLPLARGVVLPARKLVAEAPGRRENIVYWSRLGEFFPVDGGEQRMDRIKTVLQGYITDGLLARFSALGANPQRVLPLVEGFVVDLVRTVPAAQRPGLIGGKLTSAMSAAGV